MNKSNIDWCSRTWNPITGCLHTCEYCYAKGIVKRFGRETVDPLGFEFDLDGGHEHIRILECKKGFELTKSCKNPFPFGFTPTFHRYRLDEPATVKSPQTVFVGSMADIFGDWVPNEWIMDIFEACEAAPWHRYIFLTKNPKRYEEINGYSHFLNNPNVWVGFTQTGIDLLSDGEPYEFQAANIFASIEPLQQPGWKTLNYLGWCNEDCDRPSWVIIGAETGRRNGKIIPKREWIEEIVKACRDANIPVFLKNNLAEIWGEPLIQQLPWAGITNDDTMRWNTCMAVTKP